MNDLNHSGVTGFIKFIQHESNPLHLIGKFNGLKPGIHGIHVHQWGISFIPLKYVANLGNLEEYGKYVGGHFNPTCVNKHGGLCDKIRHTGDLGNIQADQYGAASFNFEVGELCINGGSCNIVGRSILINENEDDLEADT